MRAKICFLSTIHTPRDKRVFQKEARCLARVGYDVVHIAPDNRPGRTIEDGVQLVTYRAGSGVLARARRMVVLARLARNERPDFYHCNELDSWLVGLLLKLVTGACVIFDVHEHYPSRFEDRGLPRFVEWLGALVVLTSYRVFGRVTDRIVLAKKTVAPDFAGLEHKVVLVRNFAEITGAVPVDEARNADRQGDKQCVAIHIGLMSRLRGWPQLLDALSVLPGRRMRLQVLGEFFDGSRPEFLDRATALGIRDLVEVRDWMPAAEAFKFVREADIGLVVFQPGPQNHTFALPHKLFDYMIAGLPVIAPSFAVEVAEIVREAECGLLVDTSDSTAVAVALERLIDGFEERRRMGRRGRTAVLEKYNWECEAQRLTAMYRELEARVGNEASSA